MTLVDLLPDLSWGEFIYYLALLGLIYLLIWFIPLPIRWVTKSGITRRYWQDLANKIRMAYEPIALVLALIALICVNPLLHGIIVLGLVVLGWRSIRNYVDGQMIRLTTPLRPGQEIELNGTSGTVQQMHPLSMVLQTEKGSRIVAYRQLREAGFTISRGARISGVHEYTLRLEDDIQKDESFLRDHLFNCPYLNWGQQPTIRAQDGEAGTFHLRLLLEDESYADSMRQLIREWGFTIEEKI